MFKKLKFTFLEFEDFLYPKYWLFQSHVFFNYNWVSINACPIFGIIKHSTQTIIFFIISALTTLKNGC